MINRTLIETRMKEIGVDHKTLAQEIHVSEELIYQKISGLSPLTLDQAEAMQTVLRISDADFGKYFFSRTA